MKNPFDKIPLMMILLLKKKTKYVVVSDNIGLSLSDLKDIMDKIQRRSYKIIIIIKRRS